MTLKEESKTRDPSMCPENPEEKDLRRSWGRFILVKEVTGGHAGITPDQEW